MTYNHSPIIEHNERASNQTVQQLSAKNNLQALGNLSSFSQVSLLYNKLIISHDSN